MALSITKPTVGGDAGVWGTELNTALDAIVNAINAISALTPTAVKTGSYTAAAGDLVPYDLSGGNGTLTLPTAPADKTIIAAKVIALSGTNSLTINTGGSDVFNKTGGATTANLPTLNQMYVLRYNTSGAVWYIEDNLSLGALDTRYALVSKRVVLTGSGNYTPTSGCKVIRVDAIGAGGGGAGGYRAASGSVCPGGGGGGGAAYGFGTFAVSDLTIPVPYVVGTGGAGGAGATADNSAGAAGSAGNSITSFGTAGLDYFMSIGRGGGGQAPTSSAGGTAGGGAAAMLNGTSGGAGSAGVSAGSIGVNFALASAGGGGGGGVSTAPAFLSGGTGGGTNLYGGSTNAGGTSDGAAGTNGTGRATNSHTVLPANGGGGGAGSVSGTGGAGGNGGFPGGGGGGGGGATNGHVSGAGGNGGDGIIVVTEYF